MLVRLHRSLICLLHTAHFAGSAAVIRPLTCSLTHCRACGKVKYKMSQNDLVLSHSGLPRGLSRGLSSVQRFCLSVSHSLNPPTILPLHYSIVQPHQSALSVSHNVQPPICHVYQFPFPLKIQLTDNLTKSLFFLHSFRRLFILRQLDHRTVIVVCMWSSTGTF